MKHYGDLFQLSLERAVVSVAVLLDRLDPTTAHPVCENVGGSGSGKSTKTEHDVAVIDPPSKSGLRTTGQKSDDIAAAAQQQYVIVIDNASRLDQSTSDTLCVASTGGTWTGRMFREQTKTVSLHLHRAIYITCVNPVCNAPDLQTRVVRDEFPTPMGREVIGEEAIRAEIKERMPAFLGAFYTLKAASLRVLPDVRQRKGWKHRMVTFDQTGEAMLTAAGYQAGTFQKIIGQRREAMARRSASGDVFVIAVCEALRTMEKWPREADEPTSGAVIGRPRPAAVFEIKSALAALMRPSILLNLLPRPNTWDKHPAIPGTERALMDAMRRVQPTLQTMGVAYRETMYGSRPLIRIDWRPDDLDAAPAP